MRLHSISFLLLLLASSTEVHGRRLRAKEKKPQGGVDEHLQKEATNLNQAATSDAKAATKAPIAPAPCGLLAGNRKGVAVVGLFDPCSNDAPKFTEIAPNPFTPSFTYSSINPTVVACADRHMTGLRKGSARIKTDILGYKEGRDKTCTWPGKTFVATSKENLTVTWKNDIKKGEYLLTSAFGKSVVDTSLHWAFSIEGYAGYTIKANGVPIIPHVHGGHTDSISDGNAENFFTANSKIVGPQWAGHLLPNGSIPPFTYENSQNAALIWYHDHTLGITRLNVYSGMAGFYAIRDNYDTGSAGNPLTLPTYPYETALAIQDRMFKQNGELFYPAFPGDPAYVNFIVDPAAVPNPTALAEFFGDFMTVNGKIWPKLDVEPRHYRLRVLNGCDSRFLVIRFCLADEVHTTEFPGGPGSPACNSTDAIPFYVIGSDQGLRFSDKPLPEEGPDFTHLVVEPGSRYDIIMNFAGHSGKRVIMANIGRDAPFDGTFDDDPPIAKAGTYLFTDRIMAFDVHDAAETSTGTSFNVATFNAKLSEYDSDSGVPYPRRVPDPNVSIPRSVGLFEGVDEYGRLQPLLGTVYPTTVPWPSNHPDAGQPMQGTMNWHDPTTERPVLGTTEYWDIWNLSVDAHPVHLHLVHFEVVARYGIIWDGGVSGIICDPRDGSWTQYPDDPNKYEDCANDGNTYLLPQPLVQHNEKVNPWGGRRVVNPKMKTEIIEPPDYFFENAPKDSVIALPDQVTRIKATFDKPGRYTWHCHLLSHEDHEMMRVLEVV